MPGGDCHARPSPRMGLLFAKALEPFGLYWFEEPCWPESIAGYGSVSAASAGALAGVVVDLFGFATLSMLAGIAVVPLAALALRRS